MEKQNNVKAEVGNRIREMRRRRGLGLKGLAAMLRCSKSQISEWESGKHTPRDLPRLAAALGCSTFYIQTGCEVGDESAPDQPDAWPPIAMALASQFFHSAAQAIGEPIHDLLGLRKRLTAGQSNLTRLLEASAEALAEASRVSSGHEARAVKGVLNAIIEIAEMAREQGIEAAEELLFDANDKAVHCEIFASSGTWLRERTDVYLGKMAALVLDQPSFGARYYSRLGDVRHVRAWTWNDARINRLALDALQKSTARLTAKSRHRMGYHAIRTLPVVAARCEDMPDMEFDGFMDQARELLEAVPVTDYEAVHVTDGFAECSAQRYLATGTDRYRVAALRYWDDAKGRAAWLKEPHKLFAVHMARLPVILGRAGILDHLGETEQQACVSLQSMVAEVGRQAVAAGSERMAAEMTLMLRELQTKSGASFWSNAKQTFL